MLISYLHNVVVIKADRLTIHFYTHILKRSTLQCTFPEDTKILIANYIVPDMITMEEDIVLDFPEYSIENRLRKQSNR